MKDQLIRECFKQFYSVRETLLECRMYGFQVHESFIAAQFARMECEVTINVAELGDLCYAL